MTIYLKESTSLKGESIDTRAALCPPNVAVPHFYVAKDSGHLIETVRAIVVTIDLGTRVESPNFVRVTGILVARARTHRDAIEGTRNG